MEFEWDKNKAAYNLSKHSVHLMKRVLFLMIPSMLIFMIQTILMMNIGILLLDNQHRTPY